MLRKTQKVESAEVLSQEDHRRIEDELKKQGVKTAASNLRAIKITSWNR